MSVLESISVEMSIVLGSAQIPIRQILKMGRGAMIPLDRGQDDPTLVYVNDELVAKGQVLVEGSQMLFEVTEIVKRIRS
ncbi:MAG: FliM/FliN family flagellar motor switch protein [Sphingomonas sp.]|jgi:flagellar motor switch protein FliN/FliY